MLLVLATTIAIWLLLGVLAIAACIRSGQLAEPHDQYRVEHYDDRAAANFQRSFPA